MAKQVSDTKDIKKNKQSYMFLWFCLYSYKTLYFFFELKLNVICFIKSLKINNYRMQKFVQNKNSTTIAKRTIINFKKSKSIAKSINVNINVSFNHFSE